MPFHFDNSFARELNGLYQNCQPEVTVPGQIVYANHALAQSLCIDWDLDKDGQLWSDWLSGVKLPPGAEPIAQAYAGYQFGQFSPSLGDGRAVIIGEVIDRESHRYDISLKGSGRTPFSRGGDGRAALAPMLREALISEAMYALGVATTRSLAVIQTPEYIFRQKQHPCAILTRVASSHIRIGTFEYFSSRKAHDKVVALIDYTIARHHPQIAQHDCKALALLDATVDQLAVLVADWMSIGFIHGVMNTDNISMAGETIDYGPCAFIDSYDPKTVFSSIDDHGRYSYGNQPAIAQWNLARLAEALLPQIDEDKNEAIAKATVSIDRFVDQYAQAWRCRMLAKLGLVANTNDPVDPVDIGELDELVADWFNLLHSNKMDFTNSFIALADAADGDYSTLLLSTSNKQAIESWLDRWQLFRERKSVHNELHKPSGDDLRKVNPILIPRNHLVESVLDAAEAGDIEPFNLLLTAVQNPFDSSQRNSRYTEPGDHEFNKSFRTYCGT